MYNILLFAGTTEGRELAEYLSGCNLHLTVCVATEYGQTLIEEKENLSVHSGRMDLEQMKKMIRDGFGVTSDFSKKPTIDFLIDATHPYAEVVTQNLQSAAQQMGIPYYRCLREIAEEQSCLAGYEKVIHAENTEQAIELLQGTSGNILLTTGSKELAHYAKINDFAQRVYPRVLPLEQVVKGCLDLGVLPSHLIAMQGPFSKELNLAMIKQWNIQYLVTKESGKAGGFEEKIAAAKQAGITVVIIGRPTEKTQQAYSFSRLKEKLKEDFQIVPDFTKQEEKNKQFPLFVSLRDKKILVFGGGKIAARRIASLLSFGCQIRVISPEISEECQQFWQKKRIIWEKRCYQTGDCTADFVLAATNCPEVNDRIESECRSGTKKILFNRCDRKENCDFYFPALVEHDGMVIAISSSGTDYKKVKDTAAKLRAIFAEQDR